MDGIAAFLDVGPVTKGAHPYEGNDNILIYYYPETNQYVLLYYGLVLFNYIRQTDRCSLP